MARNIDKLISLGGDSICQGPAFFRTNLLYSLGDLGRELANLLKQKNGFYAFNDFPRFPACQKDGVMDLEKRNNPSLWTKPYENMASGTVFFSEGIYGDQFGIRKKEIVRFEAETGLIEPIALSLEEWASVGLNDCYYQTGYLLRGIGSKFTVPSLGVSDW